MAETSDGPIVLPSPCVVVLVGPAGAGKSTWAQRWFAPHQVVSSDGLRALVGEGEHDMAASKDAFALLDTVVERRLGRRLTTVIDTLGLDAGQRAGYRALAAAAGLPCFAVVFDVPPAELRARNRSRPAGSAVPPAVVSSQLASWPGVRDGLGDGGLRRRPPRRAGGARPGRARLPRSDRRAAGLAALRAAAPPLHLAGRAGGARASAAGDRRRRPRRPASPASG